MDSWVNGATSLDVKRVIDNNFNILDKRTEKINNDVLKLSPLDVNFIESDWSFTENTKAYTISIPYANYNKESPCVDVFIKNKDEYSLVYGGYILEKDGVTLQSDIPYEGKVVIR